MTIHSMKLMKNECAFAIVNEAHENKQRDGSCLDGGHTSSALHTYAGCNGLPTNRFSKDCILIQRAVQLIFWNRAARFIELVDDNEKGMGGFNPPIPF
jgi:hypothetical protein